MINLIKFEEDKSYELFETLMELRDKFKEFYKKISNEGISYDNFYFKKDFSNSNFGIQPAYLEAKVKYDENLEFKLNGSVDFTDFNGNICENTFYYREISGFSIDGIIFDYVLHIFPDSPR